MFWLFFVDSSIAFLWVKAKEIKLAVVSEKLLFFGYSNSKLRSFITINLKYIRMLLFADRGYHQGIVDHVRSNTLIGIY